MKKITVVLMLFLFLNNLMAQSTFAPLGAYWNYAFYSHNGGMDADWSIKVTKDTLIDGFPTKYLTRYYYNTYHYPPPYPGGISGSQDIWKLQIRGDSVFTEYNATPTGFNNFLFSFSMNIGDTIQIPSWVNIYAVVDSVSDTIIGNDTLARWHLSKYCDTLFWNPVTIIENIGPVDDYLFWNDDGCTMTAGTAYFRCFSSAFLNYNPPCWQVLNEEEITAEITVQAFPNPFNEILHLEVPNGNSDLTIEIYDFSGKKVHSGSIFRTIELPELKSGLYLIKIPEINFSKILMKV